MEALTMKDVIPYVVAWSGIIVILLLLVLVRIRQFEQQHPEMNLQKTKADRKQELRKSELRRRYKNMVVYGFSLVFMWIIGLMLILTMFKLTQRDWFILIFALCGLLWTLSGFKKSRE